MNTEQEIKSIQARIQLTDARIEHIYAEISVMKAMIQQASAPMPDGITGNSSDSPYVKSEQPNPYAVDWTNAPEWADVHCYNKDNIGRWYGLQMYGGVWMHNLDKSPFTLPDGLDWRLSKTFRPR